MVYREETYDPAERAREKQAARDENERRLRSGEATPEQIHLETSFFAPIADCIRKARIIITTRSGKKITIDKSITKPRR